MISIFDTRTMLPAVLQLKRPRTFGLDTFFPGTRQFPTKYVDIDIYSRNRKMAPFVSPVLEGKVMDRLGKTTNSYAPPYIKPKRPTTAGDLLVAQPGEAVYSPGVTNGQRALQLLMQDLMDLDDSITRREEWMAWQALTTGKINVVGEGVSDLIDFGLKSTHLITLDDSAGKELWTNPDSNLQADVTNWARTVSQDSGITPNTMVLGQDSANAFLNHPQIKASGGPLSAYKLTMGAINPTLLADGVTFLGTLQYPGVNLDVYSYDEWYVDDTIGSATFGQELPMVPVGGVVLGSTRAQNSKLYGAIQDISAMSANNGNPLPVTRFPKSWEEEDPSIRMLMLQSASLVALNQPDASLYASVCA